MLFIMIHLLTEHQWRHAIRSNSIHRMHFHDDDRNARASRGWYVGILVNFVTKLFCPSVFSSYHPIDEFENVLHFNVQEKVWAMLFELAEKSDVQILATTHSWDCIKSFTNAARNNKDVEGVLFRVGRSAKKSN